MKKISLITIFVLFIMIRLVYADPHLTCDLYPPTVTQPTEFEIYMNGVTIPVISPIQAVTGGVRLYYDLALISIGSHTVIVKAVKVDSLWGRTVSASSIPFAFTRPGAPSTPISIGLIP
jgi:hypothetical protein